jgi:hypothetical protein
MLLLLALALIACTSNSNSPEPSPPSASQKLGERERDLVEKDKAAVEALLGAPVKKTFWTNVKTPPDGTAEQVAEHEARQLDEIWVYATGSVHFIAAGNVLKVEDDASY